MIEIVVGGHAGQHVTQGFGKDIHGLLLDVLKCLGVGSDMDFFVGGFLKKIVADF